MEKLITKYGNNYCHQMGNFDFPFKEVTFQLLQDFNNWTINAFHDGFEQIIIFSKE